jgi:hypothetical protein
MNNHYKCLLIDDSGAFEFSKKIFDNFHPSNEVNLLRAKQEFIEDISNLKLEMYNDNKFNKLNDFLFGPIDFIVSDRIKQLIQNFHLPKHRYKDVKIIRKEFIGLLRKEFKYNWLILDEPYLRDFENSIDFEKSIINVIDDDENIEPQIKIKSLNDIKTIISNNQRIGNYTNQIHWNKTLSKEERRIQIDEYCKTNKTFGWAADKIVMSRKSDSNFDIFNLPTFSNMTYVSEKLVSTLQKMKIPEVEFVDPGTKSRLRGIRNPIIEFIDK